MVFVLVDDLGGTRVGPFIEVGAQIFGLGPQKSLELLAVVDVWQLGDFSDKVIEIALTFIDDLRVDNADAFIGYGGNEAAWKSLDNCGSHFVELVEPPEHIDVAPRVLSHDMVHKVLHYQ